MKLLDFDKIKNNSTVPDYIKEAARKLQKNMYLTTGEFFSGLLQRDLEDIVSRCDSFELKDGSIILHTEEAGDNLMIVSLLVLILSTGEGESGIDTNPMNQRIQNFLSVLSVEFLGRTGRLLPLRQNYSVNDSDNYIAFIRRNNAS